MAVFLTSKICGWEKFVEFMVISGTKVSLHKVCLFDVEVCDYLDIFDYRDIIRFIEIRMIGLIIVNFRKLLVYLMV